MSSLRVNKIIDEAGTGPVEFTKGVTFPSGASIPESNMIINTTGIVTTSDIVINENIEVVGVDIGGATTDVFSVFQGQFNRTVSANLGMSYRLSKGSAMRRFGSWPPCRRNVKP